MFKGFDTQRSKLIVVVPVGYYLKLQYQLIVCICFQIPMFWLPVPTLYSMEVILLKSWNNLTHIHRTFRHMIDLHEDVKV